MPVICVTELKYTCPIVRNKSYMNYLPGVCATVVIAIMSLTESSYMPSVSLNDKLMHAVLYAFLAAAWWLAIKRPVWIVIGATLYGALLELLQHYCTRTRSGEWLDLLADFLGATIAIIFAILWQRLSTTSR